MVPGFSAYDKFDDTIIYRFKILSVLRKIEVKSPSVRRLSKLYLPLTHAIPLEIRHAGKQAILTQSR